MVAATNSPLALQQEAEAKWGNIASVLQTRMRSWSFNLMVCALSELKNEGVYSYYEILEGTQCINVVLHPFRGYTKCLIIDFDKQSVRDAIQPL